MKITGDSIYGNIGYVIRFAGSRYLLRDYSWEKRQYLLDNLDTRYKVWIDDYILIGCDIIGDKWEKMNYGKI